jgi:DNA polymerase-3 subunit delta'
MPFRDCVGHRRLLRVLARSIHRGSLPPSLLLAGPEGIGKRRVALAMAQALNCTAPRHGDALHASPRAESAGTSAPGVRGGKTSPVGHGRKMSAPGAPDIDASVSAGVDLHASASADALEIDGCGQCPSCLRIARGVHPDVLLIEPQDSGVIKVDQVRDAVDRAAYRPFEGRRRVVIVDDADALMPQAQNALLKTLEEPPSASVFLLVSARPDALLPTVLSRCPQLRFRALSIEEVAGALRGRGATEAEARAVAANAEGSIGRALQASVGDLVESRDVATRVLMGVAAARDARGRLEQARELVAKPNASVSEREQLALHLRAMSSLLRDVALIGAGADTGALANTDVRSDLARLSAFDGDRGVRAFGAVDRALGALDRNASAKIVADWVLLQL